VIRLRKIEDLTLAMADDEHQDLATARWVLRTYLERNVTPGEVTAALGRLSNAGYVRWRIHTGGRVYFRSRASFAEQRSGRARFIASPTGIAYLALPRDAT
jgi:hypothetical protein